MHCEAKSSTRNTLAASDALLARHCFGASIDQGRPRTRATGGQANRSWLRPSVATFAFPGYGTAFRITDVHARRLHNRRTKRLRRGRLEWHDKNQIKRWLQLTAERRPDIGDRTLLRERPTDCQEHFPLTLRERPHEDVVRECVDVEKSHQDATEKPMLVFGPLRPCGDQV